MSKVMKYINEFIRALEECRINNPQSNGGVGEYTYNGFTICESENSYQLYLANLYKLALDEVPSLSSDAISFYSIRLNEAAANQSLFDIPPTQYLEAELKEMERGNNNKDLRKEADFLKFIYACVSWQKYFLNEFKKYIMPQNSIVSQDIIKTESEPLPNFTNCDNNEQPLRTDQEWAFGYKEIMEVFHWGRNKVASFIKDPKYADAIYRNGNKIAVNIKAARKLMALSNQKKIGVLMCPKYPKMGLLVKNST